ncbi:EIF4ENIF1 [Mytilus coruscus]|uniref:EIF4ENIF1 n=1 Tax=Mytilus coruscus TaxID=42192 RepID=A0A6J8F383_MYTCO|nr:EIF4ENIF1 [Mytilus coruscus]
MEREVNSSERRRNRKEAAKIDVDNSGYKPTYIYSRDQLHDLRNHKTSMNRPAYLSKDYDNSEGLTDPQKWIGSVHDGSGDGVSSLTLENNTKKTSYDRTSGPKGRLKNEVDGISLGTECQITSSMEYIHESDSVDYNDNSRNGRNMTLVDKDQEPEIHQESNVDNNGQLTAGVSDLPIYLGKVTYIIDLDYFYMHIGTAEQLEEFCVLEDNIASYSETLSCIENICDLWLEQMVLVDCQENNGCWRRGQVTRIDSENNSADVFYIDYGETENVKDSRICIELLEEFQSFPSQALRCCLAGIRPVSDIRGGSELSFTGIKMLPGRNKTRIRPSDIRGGSELSITGIKMLLGRNKTRIRPVSDIIGGLELSITGIKMLPGRNKTRIRPVSDIRGGSELSITGIKMLPGRNKTQVILEEVQSFPSQALRCCLAGIRPAFRCCLAGIRPVSDIRGGSELFFTDIGMLPGRNKTKNVIFKVALYSRDGKQRCLSSILVDEDLGIPVEDEVTENFEDAEEFYAARFTQSATDSYEGYDSQYNMVNGEVFGAEDISEAYQEVGDQTESIPYIDNESSFSEISPAAVDRGDNSSSSLLEIIIQRKDTCSPFASLLANICDRNSSSPTSSRKDNSSSSSRVDTSSPSSSLRLNVAAAAESAVNIGTGQSLSPQMIPQFNLDSLHKTHQTTTDKLLEKKHKEIQKESKIEQERVKKETVEQSKLAILAGYGGLEDDTSNQSKLTNTPQTPRDKWTSSELAPKSPEDWDKELRLHETNKADLALKELPPPPIEKRDTPHGRELLKVLNQIFVDSEREPVDEIRVRLLSLFQTDAYLFLNKEELGELMNTVINRAVRYYGVIHDIILEILDVLSGTQFFQECLLEAMKRVQEMYVKIQYKGKPFHVQCSKIIGHLFNMSFHWKNSIPLQEYVAFLLEKWIMFNKKGKQIGKDKLQEIYLECFEMIWEISGEALLDTVKNVKSRLLKECQDKILNTAVSQNIRSLPSEEKTEFTVPVKYQKSTRPPFFPPKSSKYYRPNSRSSTPSSVHSDKSEDSWPNLSKSSATGVRKIIKTISPVPDGKPSSNDNSFRSDGQSPAGDEVLLMTPASFTDSLHLNDHSPDDSSVYYSVSDNFNNSSLLNFKDTSSSDNLLKPTPYKSDVSETFGGGDKSLEVSPLTKLIEMDAKSTFYKSDENRNIHPNDRLHKSPKGHPVIESSPKSSSVHATQKTDWWDMDEDVKMAQSRVKDNWYDTEDSSDNISIKTEKVPAKSLADCANVLFVPAKTQRLSQPTVPQVKTNAVVNEKAYMKSSLRQEHVKTTKKSCKLCRQDTADKPEEPTASGKNKVIDWWKIGIDEDNDTDKDLDNFEDDEDWESYSGSIEDISQSQTSESVSSEVPEKTASKSNKVTIVRDYQTAEKPKPTWKPGARLCTMCGDTSHLIYDCPNKHKKGLFY